MLSRKELRREPDPQRGRLQPWRFRRTGTKSLRSQLKLSFIPRSRLILEVLPTRGVPARKTLKIPGDLSLLPMPPRAPELDGPEEHLAVHEQTWLSDPHL